MAREILVARKHGGEPTRYLLEVFEDGDHWTSTLARLDARGEPETTQVAPRFYGLSAEQARRRMITVLENDYDEVVPAPAGRA
jgi:hypothetical protein